MKEEGLWVGTQSKKQRGRVKSAASDTAVTVTANLTVLVMLASIRTTLISFIVRLLKCVHLLHRAHPPLCFIVFAQ